MPFQYLPVMAQNSAPKPPRVLVSPTKLAWCQITKPLSESRVALLSSAALRLAHQEPFIPREDFNYRRVPSDPSAGEIIIDHHSGIGRVPKQDPEIVFPRTALANLHKRGVSAAWRRCTFPSWGVCVITARLKMSWRRRSPTT